MTQIRHPLLLVGTASILACNALSTDVDKKTAQLSTNANIFAIGIGATPGKPGYDGVTRGVQLAVDRLNNDSAGRKIRFSVRPPNAGATSAELTNDLEATHRIPACTVTSFVSER